MTIRKILAYVFAIIALVFEGFFGIVPFVQFTLQVVMISFGLYLLLSLFRGKKMPSWRIVIVQYIFSILATIGFFTSIFIVFISYHNLVPGVISDITMANSGQQIVFVQMSHIATPEFYREKQTTIRALSASGYIILLEGVRPGTPENQAIFNQSIGFNFTPKTYPSLANLTGLSSQDNKTLFNGIATGSLVSVDLSIDDIVEFMGTGAIAIKKEMPTGLLKIIADLIAIFDKPNSSVVDVEGTIESLTYQEKIFFRWIAGGLFNWSLKQPQDISIALIPSGQSKLFETIIDRRNDKIVEYIITHPKEKIAVVYGALHFNGVYESLQKIDKNWKTIDIKNSTPYNR